MARTLNFELLPQKDIEQENIKSGSLVVGRRQIDFSIPDLPAQLKIGDSENKSQAQHIVNTCIFNYQLLKIRLVLTY